jgi:histidine triad (HIT) family protein
MDDCIFCKIIARQAPSYIVDENDVVMTFLSLESHPLVVPKQHITDIYGLDGKTGGELMTELIRVAIAVKKGCACDGVYITQANEPAAGQDVFHLHFHVYPRWSDRAQNHPRVVEDAERELTLRKIKSAL